MQSSKKAGFTLVELLVVIGLIGVLMGAAVAVLDPAKFFSRSRNARRKSDLGVVQAALEMYYAENNQYPVEDGVPFGGAWTPYLKSVPAEAQTGHDDYCYDVAGTGYLLCAQMEGSDYSCSLPACDCTPAGGGLTTYNYCLENPY